MLLQTATVFTNFIESNADHTQSALPCGRNFYLGGQGGREGVVK